MPVRPMPISRSTSTGMERPIAAGGFGELLGGVEVIHGGAEGRGFVATDELRENA